MKIKTVFFCFSSAVAWGRWGIYGCLACLVSAQLPASQHALVGEALGPVYQGALELRDTYGVRGDLMYTAGCLSGVVESCQIKISVPSGVGEMDEMVVPDERFFDYVNYLSYLKRTGQSLFVSFEEVLIESASEVSVYKVSFVTENKIRRFIKSVDSRTMPTLLKKNPLLLFLILATHQSSLDLMLSPDRSLYILSLGWMERKALYISGAGRGGFYGYRYYHFPRDNELFLDIGGPFSINGLSEGVGFSFADNDRTQPPVRMVTGYHGDQKNGFIARGSLAVTYLALAGGFGGSIWNKSIVGFLLSSLLLAVEVHSSAASSELQALAGKLLPEGLQFNPDFQGRHLLKVLRASAGELEPVY